MFTLDPQASAKEKKLLLFLHENPDSGLCPADWIQQFKASDFYFHLVDDSQCFSSAEPHQNQSGLAAACIPSWRKALGMMKRSRTR